MRKMQYAMIGALAAVMALNAGATTVTSTTFNGWKAGLNGAATEVDFSSVNYGDYSTSNGISLSAVGSPSTQFVFTGPDNGAYQLSGAPFGSFVALQGGSNAGAGINIALPGAGANALLVVVGSTGGPLTLSLSDGETFSLGNGGLFGLSLSHPVTSMLLTTTAGSQAVIDDLWFGASALTQDSGPVNNPPADPSPAPEGASLVLVAGGALVLFGAKRKLLPSLQS